MAGVISTGNHPAALWPGVLAWFGARYNEHPVEYSQIFDTVTSTKKYEEMVQHYGFGLVPVKDEGAASKYDSHAQGFTARFSHVAYSLGYVVTREELADNQYEEVSMARAENLAFSARQTQENVAANVLNRAFNSSYTGGDAKELLATDHPLAMGGTWSNELNPAADFSEAALEDLAIMVMNATNPRGLKISLMPKRLIMPVSLVFEAERVLQSQLQNDTSNNAINALRAKGIIPEVAVNHYLTDTDAFFIKTNAPRGLTRFEREGIQFTRDTDFDTDNAKAKVYFRETYGWGDPRGLYGSEGA
jgi:phage major head subunit gpT-like protein